MQLTFARCVAVGKEDVVTRTLCSIVLLMAIGCSKSPTAPTEPPTQSGPNAIEMQWVAAASCAPVVLPPTQPSVSTAAITNNADGSITASWPYQSGPRTGTLYARFVNQNNVFALCSWDVADI